jgi:hypothetical protein
MVLMCKFVNADKEDAKGTQLRKHRDSGEELHGK